MADLDRGLSYNLKALFKWCWLSARAVLSRRRIPHPGGYATVTLTTYGPRQWAAMLAVDSLSRGRMRPARVVLFLDGTKYDRSRLPFPLAVLARRGVEVVCLDQDYGSYKKLPLFAWYPRLRRDAGDHGRRRRALPGGLAARIPGRAGRATRNDVLCYRARRITFDGNGAFAPYQQWEFVRDGDTHYDVLPNGAYGVLYRREALEAIRNKGMAFLELAPNADDLWFRLCTLEGGMRARTLRGGTSVCPAVPFTEDNALWPVNALAGGNDQKLARIAPLFDLSRLNVNVPVGPA